MEKLINIAGLLEECKQYTKLYSVTHGDVLLDRIDKEGNIFLKVLPLDKNLTLKLDECGRLYEKGSCVLFPTIWNTWEGFDPYATTIESPFEAGMVGYNEHLNEFGIISDDGSFMTNVDGSRISPIDRLATEVEIDIWNQENHKKHRHYSPSERKTDRPTHQKSPIRTQIHISIHTKKEKQKSQLYRTEKKYPTPQKKPYKKQI